MDYGLSKSCENTLLAHACACAHHRNHYHFRSQALTLNTKRKAYGIARSRATLNRENAKLVELGYIRLKQRTKAIGDKGRTFTSSLTFLTGRGFWYLVRRRLMMHAVYRFLKGLFDRVRGKGPDPKGVEAEVTGHFLGVPLRKGIMEFVPPDEEIRIKPYVRKKST